MATEFQDDPGACAPENDVERIKKCRERNRIHARNTRERKKNQVEMMQSRISYLRQQKTALCANVADASVAEILMTLSSDASEGQGISNIDSMLNSLNSTIGREQDGNSPPTSEATDHDSRESYSEVSDTESGSKRKILRSDMEGVEALRRERNRVHAKKTRQRKKQMVQEMEQVLRGLENEVRQLTQLEGNSIKIKEEKKFEAQEKELKDARTHDALSYSNSCTSIEEGNRKDNKKTIKAENKDKKHKEGGAISTGYRCFNQKNHPFNQRSTLFAAPAPSKPVTEDSETETFPSKSPPSPRLKAEIPLSVPGSEYYHRFAEGGYPLPHSYYPYPYHIPHPYHVDPHLPPPPHYYPPPYAHVHPDWYRMPPTNLEGVPSYGEIYGSDRSYYDAMSRYSSAIRRSGEVSDETHSSAVNTIGDELKN